MAIDETVCDDFPVVASSAAEDIALSSRAAEIEIEAGAEAEAEVEATAKGSQIDEHPSGKDSAEETNTGRNKKQPIGAQPVAHSAAAGSVLHLSSLVACAASNASVKLHQTNNASGRDPGGQPPNAAPRSSKLTKRGSQSLQQQQVNQSSSQSQSQSQTRINHSLESINSRYSSSSANDDSISMQHHHQCQQQQQVHQQQLQPRQSLRHRLSTSQESGCSPIEAQLAASTCDLGINLVDGSARLGSFSALGGVSTSSLAREPAKSLVAFMGLDNLPPSQPDDDHQIGDKRDDQLGLKTASKRLEAAKPPFMFAGVLASIVGSVFFSLSVLCIKLLPYQEGFSEKVKAVCFRGVFMTLLCGVAILVQRSTFIVRRDELLVNILRATFGTFGVLGLYCALSYISMGDATALIFSSPVWTSILSHFILHEPLQWLQLIALPVSLFGIVLIAHPGFIVDIEHNQQQQQQHPANDSSSIQLVASIVQPDGNNNNTSGNYTSFVAYNQSAPLIDATPSSSFDFEHRWPGIVIALASSLLVSCVYIALKFRKTTPIQTTTFWFGMFMILASLALQLFTGPIDIPLTFYEWALLFGNGVTSWLGQSFLQWAFLYEEAGVLSIVRTLDVAMSFVLSSLFLEEEILWTSIVGATIIGLVVASIMLNEWIKKLSCSNRKNSIDDDQQQQQQQQHLSVHGLGKGAVKLQENHYHSKQSAYIIASKA